MMLRCTEIRKLEKSSTKMIVWFVLILCGVFDCIEGYMKSPIVVYPFRTVLQCILGSSKTVPSV